MLQTHVISRSHENLRFQLLPRHTVIQHLIAVAMKPLFCQNLAKYTHFGTLLIESRAITEASHHRTSLSSHGFHKLSNGHTTGNGVGIDNDVRTQSLCRKRHVSFGYNHTYCTLLSCTRGHFVSDFWNTLLHNADFGNAFSLLVVGHKSLIHHPQLPLFREFGLIHISTFRYKTRRRCRDGGQSNQSCLVIDDSSLLNQPIIVQFTVIASELCPHHLCVVVNIHQLFFHHHITRRFHLFVCFVARNIRCAEESALYRTFID